MKKIIFTVRESFAIRNVSETFECPKRERHHGLTHVERGKQVMEACFTLGLMMLALPAFSSCSLTGFCAPSNSLLSTPELTEKYVPNNLDVLQKPNAFAPQYRRPYYDLQINTEQNSNVQNKSQEAQSSSYNSNCQFGVCLPGTGTGTEVDMMQ